MLTPSQSPQFWSCAEAQLITTVVDGQLELDHPSLLPGWSRANVVAHLIGNARGLQNLVTWAATGVETPMYASIEARNAAIAELAALPQRLLHAELATAAEQLRAAYDALSTEQLTVAVRTARGEQREAFGIAWFRTRECAVHLVDLDAGITFADLPADLLDALCDEVIDWFADVDLPAIELRATDTATVRHLGGSGVGGPSTINATTPELVAWLQGRPSPSGSSRTGWATLPPWL